MQVKHKDIFTNLGELHGCDICKCAFKNKSTQLLHMAEHHTIKLCLECDLALPNKQDLKAHINETHLKCPDCFTLFGTQKELKTHKKVHIKCPM